MCHVRMSDRRRGSASVTSHIAHRTSHIPAFTLLEVLVSAAILTAVTAAIVMPFSMAAEQQQLDASRTVAAELATQMLERLATLTHTERLTYNGRNESGLAITGIDNQPLNDATLVGFTVSISSVEIALPLGTETADDAPKYCRATVTVTHAAPGMAPVTLGRLFYAN